MNTKIKNATLAIASLGALAFASTQAFAVEESKMYFKIAGGYGMNLQKTQSKDKESVYTALKLDSLASTKDLKAEEKTNKGFSGEAGIGYNFTDALRSDVTFSYKTGTSKLASKTSSDKSSQSLKFEQNTFNVAANIFYSFNNDSSFSPFVTAGLGMQIAKNKVTNVPTTDIAALAKDATATVLTSNSAAITNAEGGIANIKQLSEIKSKGKASFLYQAGFGVSYMIDQGVYFDLAYNIQNLQGGDFPKTDSKDNQPSYIAVATRGDGAGKATLATPVKTETKLKNNFRHSIMAGLRVEF